MVASSLENLMRNDSLFQVIRNCTKNYIDEKTTTFGNSQDIIIITFIHGISAINWH